MATSAKTAPAAPAEPEVPSDPHDPRIGREVPKTWDSVGFDDGAQYRCAGGYIVERQA